MSVPHALLALLSEGPKYGLRLQHEFESRTGEVWPLNVGQVYTTLQRLERDGLVETDDGEGERSRKQYRITSTGERELGDWLRTPPALVPPPRDELVIKVLVAMQIPGTDLPEIVQVHPRHVIEIMQRYTQVKAAAGEDDWRWHSSPMPRSSGSKRSFAARYRRCPLEAAPLHAAPGNDRLLTQLTR